MQASLRRVFLAAGLGILSVRDRLMSSEVITICTSASAGARAEMRSCYLIFHGLSQEKGKQGTSLALDEREVDSCPVRSQTKWISRVYL